MILRLENLLPPWAGWPGAINQGMSTGDSDMDMPLDFEAMEKAARVVFSAEHREHIQQAVKVYRTLGSGDVKAADVRRCARRVHAAARGLLDLAALSDEGPDAAALSAVLLGSRVGFLAGLGTLDAVKTRAHQEHDMLVRLDYGAKAVLDTYKARSGRPSEAQRRTSLLNAVIDAYVAAGGEKPGIVWKRGTPRNYAGPLLDLALEVIAQAEEAAVPSGPTSIGKMLHALVQRHKSK